MDAFEESKNDINIWNFFSQSSTTIFLHEFSASSHIILLLFLSISRAYKKCTMPTFEDSKRMLKHTYILNHESSLISCMGLSFCDLLLCVLNYLSGYRHGWSDLKVRYAPHLPLVLRDHICTFLGGMKIGIVGRTESGKSTLVEVLFRMLKPTNGQILIDGIDISKVGLHDLRSRLSIIPQDPIMFEGTLRSNLDPLEEYTDEQIWEALDRCQLGDEVRKKEGKLDSAVTENGENWSMGQRQLICLGRVVLKRSKVLVLDEATASVDTATDYLIQQTLKQHFSGSTVITIAHRITSILNIDKVLLLDNGLALEYDSRTNLLENKSSSFAKLVKEYAQRCSS
ncbi:ABC transporter C family member 3-like [Telopea speciosissima]|uniref:ABC transporter C family member 3-like n=1 Tax=Telopea speciosissima TaxID=54955 RepID=UPI001CC33E32|nr:ABC transporter C family member 3-like [Telopea speciosissima]